MELTSVLQTHRSTLTISDHATYHSYLTRKILSLRRRLGIVTHKSQKFSVQQITAEDVAKDQAYLELLLLQAERGWARAMQIKALRGEGEAGLKGKSRSEVISKSVKAAKIAGKIVEISKTSEARHNDLKLDAEAYRALLNGGAAFERLASANRSTRKEEWEICLRQWSVVRVIYTALLEKTNNEAYRELLSGTIDPTIRYVAYQAGVPRTVGMADVAKKYFPRDDKELVKSVEEIDQYAFTAKPKQNGEQISPTDIPSSIDWRGRKANIIDASIGQALAAVKQAESNLNDFLSNAKNSSAKDKAAAYDGILIASQDAADAAKSASDELEREKVDESNQKMQNLRMTSLAVNYALISWRVGRNRVLIDENDGVHFKTRTTTAPRRNIKNVKEVPETEESNSRKLARLRERVVLYDNTIQSIQSVQDLRGAVRDESFVNELEAKTKYFRALKCLNIAYSYRICGEHINALALLNRANTLISEASAAVSTSVSGPLDLNISQQAFEEVRSTISDLLAKNHAIATLRQFEQNSTIAAEKNLTSAAPWVQRLNDYPTPGTLVDLKNLVNYPVKIEPVPVKPIFLDIAYNYIDYPGRAPVEESNVTTNGVAETAAAAGGEEKKRGWFGFGR